MRVVLYIGHIAGVPDFMIKVGVMALVRRGCLTVFFRCLRDEDIRRALKDSNGMCILDAAV